MIPYNRNLVHLDYYSGGSWHPLAFATINYAASYTPDENSTLIIGSETLNFSLNGPGPKSLVQPLRALRLKYSTKLVGSGYFTVDSYRRRYTTDAAAAKRGKDFRTEASCSAVTAYAAALSIKVTYTKERPPNETAYQFIKQFITVSNWPGS
jgi:hypothetical protein